MNQAVAGIDDTPTALGTDFAHCGARVRHLLTGTECMGRAVKAIRRCYRPDRNWFEQDIVARIASHLFRNIFVILLETVRDFVPWRFRSHVNVISLGTRRVAFYCTHAQVKFIGIVCQLYYDIRAANAAKKPVVVA
jgi:hypothetical protein